MKASISILSGYHIKIQDWAYQSRMIQNLIQIKPNKNRRLFSLERKTRLFFNTLLKTVRFALRNIFNISDSIKMNSLRRLQRSFFKKESRNYPFNIVAETIRYCFLLFQLYNTSRTIVINNFYEVGIFVFTLNNNRFINSLFYSNENFNEEKCCRILIFTITFIL